MKLGKLGDSLEAAPAAGQAGLGTGVEDKRQNDDNRDKIYNVAIAGVEAGQYCCGAALYESSLSRGQVARLLNSPETETSLYIY